MKHLKRTLPALLLSALGFVSCRTSTDPNTGIPPGMRATINGNLWIADTTEVIQSGTCIVLMGWSGSGSDSKFISISLASSQAAPDSCPPNGDYRQGSNELITPYGSLFLASRTPSNLQGTFSFQRGVLRISDSTALVTDGEFNLNMKN